jgi:predicted N-acetyltransferase YhbS
LNENVTIRQGKIRDCADLFTVYQTTRWNCRNNTSGYINVEEVKDDHRGSGFSNWGWLVAESDGVVIGEIVAGVERNPSIGKIGVIYGLDVDARHQKRGIGTALSLAAEEALKKKGAERVVVQTPLEAYNYWMKADYFARHHLANISTTPSRIKENATMAMKTVQRRISDQLPPAARFSHVAVPGQLSSLVRMLSTKKRVGKFVEFYTQSDLAGAGAIAKGDGNVAEFVVDTYGKTDAAYAAMVSKVLLLAKKMNVREMRGVVPKDQLATLSKSARWSVEDSRYILVNKLL